MEALLDLVLAPLGAARPELGQVIREAFAQNRLDPDLDELGALKEALQDFPDAFPPGWWLDPAHCRWWLCLHVDWKASGEVEWQVQAAARTLGLPGAFGSAAAVRPGAQVPEVLAEAARWLRARGYELLMLDTGGDEYLGLPVRLDLLKPAFAAADRLSLRTSLC